MGIKLIRVTGTLPTAQPEITDLSDDGYGMGSFKLFCRPEFENGELVGLHFDEIEYFVVRHVNSRTKTVSYAVLSRAHHEKDKYPNWPNPEPEG